MVVKIAIQANPNRGKEIISLLESLGGSNPQFNGNGEVYTYYIDNNNIIRYDDAPKDYKVYTLEEFEKEFPFKIGDKVITTNSIIGFIHEFKPKEDYPYCIRTYDGIFYWYVTSALKPYKEMKEERNITLTLDKAKEWYNKGGELKEIALQAFTERELTKVDLPKSWEEFCTNYPIQTGEAIIDEQTSQIRIYKGIVARGLTHDKNIYPSEKSAEAHLAMIQLEQLRDCWRQGWIPKTYSAIYAIKFAFHGLGVYNFNSREFLSFPTKEMAEEFLKCFRSLIEQAGDLI